MTKEKQPKEYTGTWIPAAIMEDEDLTIAERMLYAEIASYKKCFASNAFFAERLKLTERSIQRYKKRLVVKGYIVIEKFDGRRQFCRVCHDNSVTPATTELSPIKKSINKNKTVSKETGGDASSTMTQFGKPEVNELLAYWKEIMGYEITSRRQMNRYAANNLLKAHPLEAVRTLVRVAAAARSDEYAPRVADFCDLHAKRNQLILWAQKQEAKIEKNQVMKI